MKEVSLVKVTSLIENDEQLKVLAPFGCGIQTGAGTITELANAQPADTVTILGLGAVGLAAIIVRALSYPSHEMHKNTDSNTGRQDQRL